MLACYGKNHNNVITAMMIEIMTSMQKHFAIELTNDFDFTFFSWTPQFIQITWSLPMEEKKSVLPMGFPQLWQISPCAIG